MTRGSQFTLGVFEPGRWGETRRVHGWPVGAKVGGLFVVSAASTLLWRLLPGAPAVWGESALLAAAAVLCLWAGFTVRRVWSWAVPALWIVGAISAVRLLGETRTPALIADVTAQAFAVFTVMLLARLLVATTKTTLLVDAIIRWLEPFRRFGAKPETFALAVALVIRSIPVLAGSVDSVLGAHAARGLRRTPRSVMVPVTMSAVSSTIALSEALAARMLPSETLPAENSPENNSVTDRRFL